MDKAIDLHFDFKNVTHYFHPILLHNIRRWQEIDETFIIKKYRGCKARNRNGMRKFIEHFRGDKCSKPKGYPYWRKTKDKYIYKGKTYLTRKTVRKLKQLKINVVNLI